MDIIVSMSRRWQAAQAHNGAPAITVAGTRGVDHTRENGAPAHINVVVRPISKATHVSKFPMTGRSFVCAQQG